MGGDGGWGRGGGGGEEENKNACFELNSILKTVWVNTGKNSSCL